MAISDVVDLLTRYMNRVRHPTSSGDRAGDPILQDLRSYLRAQLRGHSGLVSLWDEYEANPVDMQSELLGALEAIEESRPDIGLRLDAYVDEYHKTVNIGTTDEIVPEIDPNETYQTGDSPGGMTNTDQDFYDGTYIFANVERGEETEGQSIELDEDANDLERHESDGITITGIPSLFYQAYEASRQHPDLDNEAKSKIGNYLRLIEAQVEQAEEADAGVVRANLEKIRTISSDIVDLLMQSEEFVDYLRGQPDDYLAGDTD